MLKRVCPNVKVTRYGKEKKISYREASHKLAEQRHLMEVQLQKVPAKKKSVLKSKKGWGSSYGYK